jgi:hypothetical protein
MRILAIVALGAALAARVTLKLGIGAKPNGRLSADRQQMIPRKHI